MNKLLDRGRFFVEPGEEIYGGQVVGEHTRDRDLNINICKTKKLTNVRASGSDEKVVLPPAIKFSLEEAMASPVSRDTREPLVRISMSPL